jgi:hypothetical protein
MIGRVDCKCGEEVFIDIEAAGPLGPLEVWDVKDLLPEEFRSTPDQMIEDGLEEFAKIGGLKRSGFSRNAPNAEPCVCTIFGYR